MPKNLQKSSIKIQVILQHKEEADFKSSYSV